MSVDRDSLTPLGCFVVGAGLASDFFFIEGMVDMLNYGSFEKIIHKYSTSQASMEDLANTLLTSPLFDDGTRRSQHRKGPDISKLRSGERPIPTDILALYEDPKSLGDIKKCFSEEILPYIQDCDREDVKAEICQLVQEDDNLTVSKKAYFKGLALREDTAGFLAEVYRAAVFWKEPKPKVTNLPPRNVFFHGREALLDTIDQYYQSGKRIVGLYGMGGVGKTQAALQYAYGHFEDHAVFWWINAESKVALHNGVHGFLSAQKCLPKNKDAENVRTAFLEYLAKKRKWLLIYDNAEYGTPDEYETLKSYIPDCASRGRIILTTRCRQAFEDAAHIEIKVFGEGEAQSFLQLRSGVNDSLGALKLAVQMGCLPLALEYAAAYIRETPGVDYADYGKKLEKFGARLLDQEIGHQFYKDTVRGAFHITLDKLLYHFDLDPAARSAGQFLNVCAFLAPEGIDMEIFASFGGALPEPLKNVLADGLERDRLARDLTRHSLVQVEKDLLSIHRLLQEVLIDEIPEGEEMLYINYAYGVIYAPFYQVATGNRASSWELAPLAPHMHSILRRYAQYCQKTGKDAEDRTVVAREFFAWSSLLVTGLGQLDGPGLEGVCRKNIPALQTTLDFYDLLPGGGDIYQAYTLMLLAQSTEGLGDDQAAAQYYRDALDSTDQTVSLLLEDDGLCCDDTLQRMCQLEAFQMAADICAAVNGSRLISQYTNLIWESHRCLIRILQKQLACFPLKEDAGQYAVTWRYLQICSHQIACLAQRTFMLRVGAPESWLLERDGLPIYGPYGFFFPEEGLEGTENVTADILDGFDGILDSGNGKDAARKLSVPWTTLAFTEDIRTGDAILKILVDTDIEDLDISAKRSLYGAVYMLAKRLGYADIVEQYEKRLYDLPHRY